MLSPPQVNATQAGLGETVSVMQVFICCVSQSVHKGSNPNIAHNTYNAHNAPSCHCPAVAQAFDLACWSLCACNNPHNSCHQLVAWDLNQQPHTYAHSRFGLLCNPAIQRS
jgi:hypothetical protein